jgi:hypothetical protein
MLIHKGDELLTIRAVRCGRWPKVAAGQAVELLNKTRCVGGLLTAARKLRSISLLIDFTVIHGHAFPPNLRHLTETISPASAP